MEATEAKIVPCKSAVIVLLLFSQRRSGPGVGEEVELEDAAAVLFAEAQARAREQAAYEQLKASGTLDTAK